MSEAKIEPRRAFFEESPDPTRHFEGGMDEGSMPAIVAGSPRA